ncbi:unnamed protein product, partial [Mesorhabditis spiculigera]
MEPNTLLVSVLNARGLYLKGHATMDALVTVTMHGKGSLRSRAVTEHLQTEGDCRWDEHMEFKISDPAANLIICAQHKSRIGRNDVIGRVEIPLDQARGIRGEHWYPLRKKASEDKYRGEVQLRFEFRFEKSQLSVSNQSLNTIGHKESVMDKIKGKIKLGKLRHKNDPDGMSIASGVSGISAFSAVSKVSKSGTLSKLFGKKNKSKHDDDSTSHTSLGDERRSPMPGASHLEPPGQSNPPAAFQRSGSRRWQQSSFGRQPAATTITTPTLGSTPRVPALERKASEDSLGRSYRDHRLSNGSTYKELVFDAPPVSPPTIGVSSMSTAEPFVPPSSHHHHPRPPSVASSGIGSNHRNQNGSDDAHDNGRDNDLLARIDKLEMEIRVKDSRMRDMEEYMDGLLARVMEHCPELLSSTSANPMGLKSMKNNRRFYSTIGF